MPLNSAPAPLNRLILASSNSGKLREFRELLCGLPVLIESMDAFGVTSPPETGSSFLENALLKARHAAQTCAAPALADDSGLEVDALGGAPGINSARYAGSGASDAENNAKLVAALEGVPVQRRGARYRCVLALVRGPHDEHPITAEGVWEGRIIDVPRGAGGFGYDPYFWLPGLQRTAAELVAPEKNRLSHRGIATRRLRERLATFFPAST